MLQYAKIDINSSGDNIVVLGVYYPNRRLRVISYTLLTDTDVSVKWISGATDLSGPMAIAAKGGVTVTSNFNTNGGPLGIFDTLQVEEDLILNLDAGAIVGGHMTYYVLT